MAQDGVGGLHAAEEVHHAFFELSFEPGDVARCVDFRERHAEFFAQPPEPREEDAAGEEVVLPVGALEHYCDIILYHTRGGRHGVFGEGRGEGEDFVGEQVCHSVGGGAVEGGVALREIGAAIGGDKWDLTARWVDHELGLNKDRALTALPEAQWHRRTLRVRSYSICRHAL